ncbi:MAG TPA: hypothetical protein VLV89_01860, partial [Candidatus Acidoferrum sp.]|nr:hypothetical protein [Candidatus Acidoferrum sp.]
QLDLTLPTLYRKPEPIPAPTPETLAQGKTLMTHAVQAAGGAAISNVQSLEYSSAGTIAVGQGQEAAIQKVTVLFPDHIRIDTELFAAGADQGTVTRGYDGKTGWLQVPGGQGSVAVAESQNVELIRPILLAGAWGLFRSMQAGDAIQAQSLGQVDFAGHKADAMVITAGSVQLVAYLDPATALFMGVRYPQDLQQGKVWTVEIWTDYRDVQGMKFPFHRVVVRGGQKFSEDELQDVKINTNPNSSVFAKPQ